MNSCRVLWLIATVVIYTFALSLSSSYGAGTNDNFSNAIVFMGNQQNSAFTGITDATTEPGEPAHFGEVPCKSLWWRWQAPMNHNAQISVDPRDASTTNIMVAVYTGSIVEALSLVTKAIRRVDFQAVGGTTYQIATAVLSETEGDFFVTILQGTTDANASVGVPGNLLREPSFEKTGLEFTYWHSDNLVAGAVNESGGADGSTWVTFYGSRNLWQDFATVPGRNYRIFFAFNGDGARLRVNWDNRMLGYAEIPDGESYFWHWAEFVATASNTTSRLTFENTGPTADLDAVSVVWMNEPASIVTPPVSISTPAGGTASFLVGATGVAPLRYQWYFEGNAIPGQNTKSLVLDSVSTTNAGHYYVVVTNAFRAVTSAPVSLAVEAPPLSPIIVLQPYGERVVVGGYFALSVAAIGTPPLKYQWFLNEVAIQDATNRQLVFAGFQPTNAGIYAVSVSNSAGSVRSLPATLSTVQASGGGMVSLANWFFSGTGTNEVPVFDVDSVTRLSGSIYVAQLYAGETLALLRAVGEPTPFLTGHEDGFFQSQVVTLPTVPPGSNAFVQVRVWDSRKGVSYEEARVLGSKFGRSDAFELTAGGGTNPPQNLTDLTSFSLQAGLPEFVVGRIDIEGRQEDGTVIWSLVGNAGYRYVIERCIGNFVWYPLMVLTNNTGTMTFIDPNQVSTNLVFYRARILD